MKKAIELLRKYDHIWGTPLAILILIFSNIISNKWFNDPLISTEYLAPLFVTAVVVTLIHAISIGGMWLNHKDVFKTYNDENSFSYFNTREKVLLYLVIYGFYFILALIVYFYVNNLMFV